MADIKQNVGSPFDDFAEGTFVSFEAGQEIGASDFKTSGDAKMASLTKSGNMKAPTEDQIAAGGK